MNEINLSQYFGPFPAGIYLFKVKAETTEQSVKFVQS